jgi:hypothetical protein
LINLTSWLAPVVGEIEPAPVRGPQRWWPGPLDVEGLALGSVGAAAAAFREISNWEPPVESSRTAASFDSPSYLRVNGRPVPQFSPLSAFFRCADGWIRTHANYPHHEAALLTALNAAADPAAVAAALAELPALEAERGIRAAGGVAAAVCTPGEWAASEPGRAVAEEPWIRFELADRPRTPRTDLPGTRILDLTRTLAGPVATRFLGAIGSDVLRIDPPNLPELIIHHLDGGLDKRVAVADLAEHADVVHGLLDEADVLITGYRPGALDRFGLDWASISERHPGLSLVTLDAWGDRGPWAQERGFDSVVQAATGIAHVYGAGDGEEWKPGALPVQALDHATGYGVAAAAIALMGRAEGPGWAHLSLARTAQELLTAPPPQGRLEPQLSERRNAQTGYGVITFVVPPLLQMEYRNPPGEIGGADLEWLERFGEEDDDHHH